MVPISERQEKPAVLMGIAERQIRINDKGADSDSKRLTPR